MSATMAFVDKKREREWFAYLGAMASNERLALIHENEQLLHDLYVTGEITMEDAQLVVAGELTIEDLVGNTSLLAYKCVLCHDTGCEFCGKVD